MVIVVKNSLNFFLWGILYLISLNIYAQVRPGKTDPISLFEFDGNTHNTDPENKSITLESKNTFFTKGIENQGIHISPKDKSGILSITDNSQVFGSNKDFSLQFWVKTKVDTKHPFVLLSKKDFYNTNLVSQQKKGWVFYFYAGSWAWNMGSGKRRITYQRDNGKIMPLNDGKWHQLSLTYDSKLSEVRLYYDGLNKAIYNVNDNKGFDFTNNHNLIVGAKKGYQKNVGKIVPAIKEGAKNLQKLVNGFNQLCIQYNVNKLKKEDFESLIVAPKELFEKKLTENKNTPSISHKSIDFDPIQKLRNKLLKNPYTVHQVRDFMEVAPLLKIYSLHNGKIKTNKNKAQSYSENEKLYPPDFDMDKFGIWDRVLSGQEILNSYKLYFQPNIVKLENNLASIKVADWNIHHGGKHFTVKENGWDSRKRIAEILKKEGADIIMLQETYSSGDFIAAELGYYYATTIDWDYLHQGSNISVLSRYPIKKVYVPSEAGFMNVAAKITISKSQEIYIMSNWYGMNQFDTVYNFHKTRFDESDNIPTILAGDFNAIPNTDNGNNPASLKLLQNGFTDAYRNTYPNVRQYPGYTFQDGSRIDQMYYKGKGLNNNSINIISTWPSGFPSDHYLMIATFQLN